MLECLIFHRGGFLSGYEWVMIQNVHGKLELDAFSFSGAYPREAFPHRHALWSKERSRRWLAKLEAIPLNAWKTEYWTDDCDGEQWSLRYRFEGEKERTISGSNAWPEEWASFSGWIGSIVRKLPASETLGFEELAAVVMERLHTINQ